jgi:hypothetical protein
VPLDLAKKLLSYGLHKTLIGVPANTDLSINRIALVNGKPTLSRVGAVRMFPLSAIGRVALPDPALDIPWTHSLTFYGRRFDNYKTSDPTGVVRKKIASASKAMTLIQIRRDDDYAITGSFYNVFQEIMEAKEQVPLVLWTHALTNIDSFPVILIDTHTDTMDIDYAAILRMMLKQDPPPVQVTMPTIVGGLEVEEISAEEFNKYFGHLSVNKAETVR